MKPGNLPYEDTCNVINNSNSREALREGLRNIDAKDLVVSLNDIKSKV